MFALPFGVRPTSLGACVPLLVTPGCLSHVTCHLVQLHTAVQLPGRHHALVMSPLAESAVEPIALATPALRTPSLAAVGAVQQACTAILLS